MKDYELRKALSDAIAYLDYSGVDVGHRVKDAIKTVAFYQRSIEGLIRDLYRGDIGQADFENGLVDLIDQQLDRAWREGMRKNELDPEKDMTPEMEQELERIKLAELDHVTGFAEAITEAAEKDAENEKPKESLPGLYVRGGAWSNRYNDVVTQAVQFTAEPDNKLAWRLGATEEHCETCAALDGLVATAEEWAESGFKPQAPPNGMLDCGGWRCDCSLEPTGDKISKNRFDVWDSLR